ncbi:MAG TPA: IclR family transcriptional regulator [Acidobacteriaceae bacterium]|nr:IclR family transcriptional regulator [Acidobacteriaceae bacterium]
MKVRKSNAAPVGVLTKVLSIFDLLDRSHDGLQLRAIAEQTKLNKSTAYRFLAHLERAGYLVRDNTGAYLLGPRLVHLGSGSTYQSTIRKVSHPILDALWRETGETVNLAVLDGREILYLDVIESPHNFRLVSQVGMRRPLHCTALGKAVLAWQSAGFRNELLSTAKFEKLTPHSITRSSELIAELGRIQRRGYALDDEEVELGARCVGAPVLDSSGQVAAGVSVSGPTIRMARARTTQIAEAVKSAALEISSHLGYNRNDSVRH